MIKCQYCQHICKKDGKQKNGIQKYRCKSCNKYQQEVYKYQAKIVAKRKLVIPLLVNNCGFRGMARVLQCSVNTVKEIINTKASTLREPPVPPNGVYEVDELKAYARKGKPKIYAVYGIELNSKRIIGINTGERNKRLLRKNIHAILLTRPRKIYTDGLAIYRSLIPREIHQVSKSMLSHIERLHLTARNALKMLNRKTLAFPRNPQTLLSCLKLLHWQ